MDGIDANWDISETNRCAQRNSVATSRSWVWKHDARDLAKWSNAQNRYARLFFATICCRRCSPRVIETERFRDFFYGVGIARSFLVSIDLLQCEHAGSAEF